MRQIWSLCPSSADDFDTTRTDQFLYFFKVIENLATEPIERKSAAEASVFLKCPPLAPGDAFDVGLRAKHSSAIFGLIFPHRDSYRKAGYRRKNRRN
jgi:hypothetical protein